MSTVIKTILLEGAGTFPIDMLRHDAAYPKSPRDSALIRTSVQSEPKDPIRIELCTAKKYSPTTSLWEASGWKVVKVS